MPPESIGDRIQTSQGQRREFQLGKSELLWNTSNTLKKEPRRLDNRERFRERVAFRLVFRSVTVGKSI